MINMIYITDTECPEGYVKCQTGFQCIHIDWLCNDYPNCPDGSDESEETCKGKVEIKVDYSLPKGYSRDISPKIVIYFRDKGFTCISYVLLCKYIGGIDFTYMPVKY